MTTNTILALSGKAGALLISSLLLAALTSCASAPPVHEKGAANCALSDISIAVDVPNGYTHLPTECPRVSYLRQLGQFHVRGFYIVRSPFLYHSSGRESPTETVANFLVLVQYLYDKKYKGTNYFTRPFDETADYPPSFIDRGVVCRGLVVRLPDSYAKRKGVEWRRGIMCLVESPPRGSEQWTMVQAFYVDKNLESPDYKPGPDFEQAARKLFRSVRLASPGKVQ